MNHRLIEKLEATTPPCSTCHNPTHFVMGCAYELLKCDICGQVVVAPLSLTLTIRAAYAPLFFGKICGQKRIQPSIL